jgi:hypothetical protein
MEELKMNVKGIPVTVMTVPDVLYIPMIDEGDVETMDGIDGGCRLVRCFTDKAAAEAHAKEIEYPVVASIGGVEAFNTALSRGLGLAVDDGSDELTIYDHIAKAQGESNG